MRNNSFFNGLIIFSLVFSLVVISQAQTQSIYWTGDGGAGIRITVSEPAGTGLVAQEEALLPLIQSTIIGAFQRFSAMTVFDRQNLENILREQQLTLSGDFSDENFIRIGQLTNARLIVFGSITRISNNYILELAVTDVETGERKASFPPRQVSLMSLENLSIIREASADLLRQLGINLTNTGLQELRRTEDSARIQAENALARGIAAQRQGTVVEALTYFFQAAALNPSLSEAVSRASVISANISTGNLGVDVRNRLQIHDEWRTIVNAAGSFYANHLPYEFVFGTDIRQSAINFEHRTVDLAINLSLIPTDAWETINYLRQGLRNARGNDLWNFSLDQIEPRQITFTVQILNENNIVLSEASHTFFDPSERSRTNDTLTFRNVNAYYITDRLTVNILSVNGMSAQQAGETGFIQIMTTADYDRRIAQLREAEETARRERAAIAEAESAARRERQAAEEAARRERRAEEAARFAESLRYRNAIDIGIFFEHDLDVTGMFGFLGGAYISPIPFTAIGMEGRFAFRRRVDEDNNDFLFYTGISPSLGLIFPIGNSMQIFSNAMLDIFHNNNNLQGMITDWMTPRLDVGINYFPTFIAGYFLKFQGAFYRNNFTYSFALGFSIKMNWR